MYRVRKTSQNCIKRNEMEIIINNNHKLLIIYGFYVVFMFMQNMFIEKIQKNKCMRGVN